MRKVHPRFCAQNGLQFPKRWGFGKYVPEYAFRLGRSFPLSLYMESASRNGDPNRDALSAIEDMRLRIGCSAYAYACCQVSTSSLAAA